MCGPPNGSSSLGLGQSNPDMLYTIEHVGQRMNTGWFLAVCFATRSDKFWRASSKATCTQSRAICANSAVAAVLPS